jgi:hypothetical protein
MLKISKKEKYENPLFNKMPHAPIVQMGMKLNMHVTCRMNFCKSMLQLVE